MSIKLNMLFLSSLFVCFFFVLANINNSLLCFDFMKCSKATEKCNLWNIQDLLIFIAMGFVGGLLGAWFNQLNKHLTVHRILHVNVRPKYVRY